MAKQKEETPTTIVTADTSSISPFWDEEKLVSVLHTALNKYEVMVWNGAEKPSSKPLSKAIEYISSDVRGMRVVLDENTKLLSGARTRKKLFSPLHEFFSGIENATKQSKLFRIMMFLIGFASTIFTLIFGIMKLFGQ